MRMCDAHWQQLKTAIEDRGLGKFIAKNGEAAVAKLTSETMNEQEAFEPLIGAHNAILMNALEAVGFQLFASDGCPLCTVISSCTCGQGEQCPFRSWINLAADDALAVAKQLGLMPEN
jgi:hypothetical protein